MTYCDFVNIYRYLYKLKAAVKVKPLKLEFLEKGMEYPMCVWIKLKRENPNLGCMDWVFSEIPAPPIMKYISAPISGITFSFEFSVPKWVPA